jgi:hypothetical protein
MFPSPIATSDEGKIYRVVTGTSGRLIALVMDTLDGEVRLLDAQSLARRGALLLGATRTARGCALAPGDASLAVASHDDLQVFDLSAGARRWEAPLFGDEPAVAFAPDGARVAVGDAQGGVAVFAASDGRVIGRAALGDEPRAIVWDRGGLLALLPRELVALEPDGAVAWRTEFASQHDEGCELCGIDPERVAIAGTGAAGVWVELRARESGRLVGELSLDDRRAEGLAFGGGVLFLATEGGVYRADPPFEQLVQWLPPLGGVHDPTRLAGVTDGHLAVVARDVRVFRTRS